MILETENMTSLEKNELITIDRFITEEEDLHPFATGEFTRLLHDLNFAARLISREVRRAGLSGVLGFTDNFNVHGEKVRKLDEFANEAIIRTLERSGVVCVMASEEETDLVRVSDGLKSGKYVLVFDPLDGSTNIDVNITVGTIFSLYKKRDPSSLELGDEEDVLQPGYKQEAAGYVLYGSSTEFVYTTGHGVNIFTYDPTIGEFLLTKRNVKIPKKASHFSCNLGNYSLWSKGARKYIDYLQTPSEDGVRPYTLRYIASAVADVHRTLHYGGVYMYPADTKHPDGKLRLVYEANALAMIVERAGGRATDGKRRILDVKPHSVHQRTPLFIGSEGNVDEVESFLKKYDHIDK